MSKQHLKGPSRVDACKCLQDALGEADIGSDGHLEGETVGEGDVLPNGLEDVGVLSRHHRLGGEPQVPELYEERLQGLDFEDLGERHPREGVVHLHDDNYIYNRITDQTTGEGVFQKAGEGVFPKAVY